MVRQAATARAELISADRIASHLRVVQSSFARVLTEFVAHVFGRAFTDILSGYRVFSRRFAKSFPALATGFEIETELTVHALELGIAIGEVPLRWNGV